MMVHLLNLFVITVTAHGQHLALSVLIRDLKRSFGGLHASVSPAGGLGLACFRRYRDRDRGARGPAARDGDDAAPFKFQVGDSRGPLGGNLGW
jgi:hypothetical protein